MIYNVRGPSGAGKSWVARQVLDRFGMQEEMYGADQRTIEGYILGSPLPCFLVGSYAAPTGGADALHGGWDQIAEILRQWRLWPVILEGIRINSGHTNMIDLVKKEKMDLEVIFLSTPEEVCFQNVMARRESARTTRKVDQVRYWIRDHIQRNERQKKHFREAGISSRIVSSEEAVTYLTSVLGGQP